ncbi:MAG: hypothetical protein H6536_04905 [Bacteroidales bacterium]|nr:hypothetical protein [Bacteroidales bacterium]
MDIFYIDLRPNGNGEYEMHRSGCKHLPDQASRYYLGLFGTCNEAMKEAQKSFPKSCGCPFCCKTCNIESGVKANRKVETQ